MKRALKVSLALLLTALAGRADATAEWVKLYRSDMASPEWLRIITDASRGYVVAIHGNSFHIDVGMDDGARKGGMYLVYSERSPHDGNEPVAVLMVSQTSGKYSICAMTRYAGGGPLQVGDRVIPVAVSSRREAAAAPVLAVQNGATVTEGYISQGSSSGIPIPSRYSDTPAAGYPALTRIIAPASVAEYSPQMTIPANAYPEAAQYNYQPRTVYAPAPPQSPFPGSVTYPPYPNYPQTGQIQLDFDANKIADARLIRTLPLSQPDMNALEIQFRSGYNLFAAGRYNESLDAFMNQRGFHGNYLSPYWAGISAMKLGDRQTAIALFNESLAINPYYEPARHGLLTANGTIKETPQKPVVKPKPTVRRNASKKAK